MAVAPPDDWARAYSRRLIITDVIVVLSAVGVSQLIWFGLQNSGLAIRGDVAVAYSAVSLVIAGAWLLLLRIYGSRDRREVGSGTAEYRRVARATFALFGVFAMIAYVAKVDLARGYFLTALPVGFFFLLLGRWLWRQWLHAQRTRGECMSPVLLAGSRSKVAHVARSIAVERSAGLTVAAVLIPEGRVGMQVEGLPVLGDLGAVLGAVEEAGVTTIVLTDSDDLSHEAVRALGWSLEASGVSLIVVPALTDVAGPRIHARPVSGLPLIHVEFPVFEGRRHLVKRAFDLVLSSSVLLLLSPVFLVIAAAVRLDSPGPALFTQERVGLNGAPFRLFKFRSMTTDAEAVLPSLLDQSEGSGVLFKLKRDPRVTRIGRVLRRHSLDELPQFLNVLRGEMSVVGPRPPLASEVFKYDDATRRRLLVKPGITGLWQVSGRSDLSWEDSIRLDLYYVENWSLTGDFIILYRTIRAVLRPTGAY